MKKRMRTVLDGDRRSSAFIGGFILRPVATLCLLVSAAIAHPGSGIVVDRQGLIYFVDTGQGVWKVDVKGRLVQHDGPAFHWMTIDHDGRFAKTRLPSSSTSEVRQAGVNPTLILSSFFPLT